MSIKNYVFTGTNEDLVDNSFDILSDIDVRAIKRTEEGNIYITKGDNRVLSIIGNLENYIDMALLKEIIIEK